MPESLALRTLQLPPSGKTASGPAGMPDDSSAADFHAVLEQQLGGAPAEVKSVPLAEAGTAQEAAAEASSPDAHALASGSTEAAAALMAMQAAATSVRASPTANPGELPAVDKRGPGPGRLERVEDEAATGMKGIGAAEEPAKAAIPAAAQDSQILLPERGPARESLQAPTDPGPRVDLGVNPALERAEGASRQAPAAASPLDEPVSIARRTFASDVGDRVLWMASNNRQVAELRVDPPQLGPVEVRLSITGEQATVTLVAAHAGVREALQASIPRLQDMIQSIGLELGNVTVGSDASPRHQEQSQERSGRHAGGPASEPIGMTESRAWTPPRAGIGLVDTYA